MCPVQVSWLPDRPARRAFPSSRTVAMLGDRPRLQWRVRAGFPPASLLALTVPGLASLCTRATQIQVVRGLKVRGMPLVRRTTSSAAAATVWLHLPSRSRYWRARALSGTMPIPTSFVTNTVVAW